MKVYFAALLANSYSGRVYADVPSALPPDDEDSTFELKREFHIMCIALPWALTTLYAQKVIIPIPNIMVLFLMSHRCV